MNGNRIATFLLGAITGVVATIGAYTFGFWLSSPYDEIIDLRAQVTEQALEIESQRRDIATQAEALRSLDTRNLSTATTIPPSRESRPASPPFAPSPAPAAAGTPPPPRRTLEFDYADFMIARRFTAEQSLTFVDILARGDQPGADAAMRAFLPRTEDYAAFKTYTRQLPERRSVRDLRASLERLARPLTPEQEQALIALFGRERKAAHFPVDPDALNAAIAASPEAGPRLLKDCGAMSQRILDASARILDADQMEALRRLQNDEFQRLKLTVEMTPPPPQ